MSASTEIRVPISPGELIDKITILEIKAEWTALRDINSKLWVIEDEIRDKERDQQFDARFIELARAVYFTNDERAAVKRKINDKLGSKIVEEKSYKEYKQP